MLQNYNFTNLDYKLTFTLIVIDALACFSSRLQTMLYSGKATKWLKLTNASWITLDQQSSQSMRGPDKVQSDKRIVFLSKV